MNIRKLYKDEVPPLDLLLLADPSEEMIMGYLQRGTCYIAEDENSVLGVFVLLPTRPGTIELVNVAVIKRHQGKGIGKKLVMFAIDKARESGYQSIEIGTGNSSIGQLALYQKCGFRIIGIDPDFFITHYSEEIYENGIQCRDMIRLKLDL
ncbi:GNAT family N-acetyltransferase [Ornithinibacillus bavariensis]|uniref:N-acetyltransferase n=1 Tax=Ornithinibacillus bavariensis TaxID=545502 RepID=A0A919X8Q5_9BACI|nr:GNAT family N-acetyltransferase [Ornithinibacillus bavariensis]GIO27104.1 N-acetyltransferase [Ornithinibacillus bavariensis]HAM80172.1 GNAT family N-acetyltransferase [Ornithinibacillus sp.]